MLKRIYIVISSGVPIYRDEVEKSGKIANNPDFSTPFAALTTVEMTSFLKMYTQYNTLYARRTTSHESRILHSYSLAYTKVLRFQKCTATFVFDFSVHL